jgi:hypothetical protein
VETYRLHLPLSSAWPWKLLTEYIERALQFERLAAEETNPEIKAQFEARRRPIESSWWSGPQNMAFRRQVSPNCKMSPTPEGNPK